MVLLIVALPIAMVIGVLIAVSVTKKPSTSPPADPNEGVRRLGLTRVIGGAGYTGKLGECDVTTEPHEVSLGDTTVTYQRLRVAHAGVDKALTAKNEANFRVRAGSVRGADMSMGAHDFDRLIDVGGASDAWCFVSPRAREAFVALAAMHSFELRSGALSIDQYLPGNELHECLQRMAAVLNAIAAGARDPVKTLVGNVDASSDRPFVARCVCLLRARHAQALIDVRDKVASLTGFGLHLPPKDEHVPRILLFHPDATVRLDALKELARIGTPQTLKFLAEHASLLDARALEETKAAITERHPELAAGSGNLSLAEDTAGSLSREVGEGQREAQGEGLPKPKPNPKPNSVRS